MNKLIKLLVVGSVILFLTGCLSLGKKTVSKRDTAYAKAHNKAAGVYAKKNQYIFAMIELDKAEKKDPKYAPTYNNRGTLYHKRKKYNRAIEQYNTAIAINPMYYKAHYNRGKSFIKKKKYKEAIQDFTKTIQINPEHAMAYVRRGYIGIIHFNDNGQGCADLKKACELEMCSSYALSKEKGDCK